MPNFGGRKPRSAAGNSGAGRPSAGSTGRGKPREDGRGGRSPQRENNFEKKPGKRPAFFEADAPRSERPARDERPTRGSRDERPARDDRGGRPFSRDERPGRGDRPFVRDDRAGRGRSGDDRGFSRDERPARDDRGFGRGGDDRRGGRSFDGGRGREMSGGREDRGRDWSPEGRPARGRFEDRGFSRDDRRGGDDRGGRGFSRDDRRGGDDRGFGRGGDDRRGGRSFDGGRGRSFEERDGRRPDRVARDESRERSFSGARDRNGGKKSFVEDKVLERMESVTDAVVMETFEEMELHPLVIKALQGMGAEKPFPIQAATIPVAMTGVDVLGRGKTGSGKTVSFTVPMVQKLIKAGSVPRKPGKPRALILAPTRELADQIDRTVNGLARPVGFYTTCIYGGVPQRKQENAMSRGVDIVVATPGRLEDLMAQRIIDLSEVETLIVDEADHMSELGFIEPLRRIMATVNEDCQKLLFSATLDKAVKSIVDQFLPAPFIYEVPEEDEDHSNITHRVLVVEEVDRSAIVLRLVQGFGKSLIFARTKMTAERLSESLTAAGVPAARLHGDLNQSQRNRNLQRFTSGECRVLVATDVAARGIHVDDVALVIQVDPPQEYKTYLHRSGRTGRAGKEGTVVTLIPRSRRRRMEDLLNRADRDGIYSEVRPSNPLLEELAGPIAPPPAAQSLDFGDSRGGGRDGGRGSRDGGGRGRFGDRDGGRGSRDGGGRGRGHHSRPTGARKPRD